MSFGKCSGKIIYKIVEKLLTNTGRGYIIKVEIKVRATARKECKMYYVIKRNGDEMVEQVKFNTFSDAMDFYATYNYDEIVTRDENGYICDTLVSRQRSVK